MRRRINSIAMPCTHRPCTNTTVSGAALIDDRKSGSLLVARSLSKKRTHSAENERRVTSNEPLFSGRGDAAVLRDLVRREMADVAPQQEAPGAAAVAEQVHARVDERHRARRAMVEAVGGAIKRIEHQAVADDHHLASAVPACELGQAAKAAPREFARALAAGNRIIRV